MPAINLSTLQLLRDKEASIAAYYRERIGEKPAQNAALIAAGLKPLHSEATLKWDADSLAEHERSIEALDAVLAHFGGTAEAEAA